MDCTSCQGNRVGGGLRGAGGQWEVNSEWMEAPLWSSLDQQDSGWSETHTHTHTHTHTQMLSHITTADEQRHHPVICGLTGYAVSHATDNNNNNNNNNNNTHTHTEIQQPSPPPPPRHQRNTQANNLIIKKANNSLHVNKV